MATVEQLKDFYKQLKLAFPQSKDLGSDQLQIANFVKNLAQFNYETLIKAVVFMQIDLKTFPTVSEIISFCDKIEGSEKPDVLNEVLRLIRKYSTDERRWPAQPKAIAKLIARLGGLQRINSFTEQELSYRENQARQIYKEIRSMERAGAFDKEMLDEVEGIRVLKPGGEVKPPVTYFPVNKGKRFITYEEIIKARPKANILTTARERLEAYEQGLDPDNFDPKVLHKFGQEKKNQMAPEEKANWDQAKNIES